MYSLDKDEVTLQPPTGAGEGERTVTLPTEPYYRTVRLPVTDSFNDEYLLNPRSLNIRVTVPRWVTPKDPSKEGVYELTEADIENGELPLYLYASSPALADKKYADGTVTVDLLFEETVIATAEFTVEADYGMIHQE